LLRSGDFGWKELVPGQTRPGYILSAQVKDADYIGAITRRSFIEGEAFIESELVKPGDRRFLAAVLKPGNRAVSISVDASQSSSGLILAGDNVDVILTQSFDEKKDVARKSVSETILHNVRVVAIDHSLAQQIKAAGEGSVLSSETRIPKTVTLELDEQQAQKLFVAVQLGRLHLAVRPLEGSGQASANEMRKLEPVWASDVSRALKEIARREPKMNGARGEETAVDTACDMPTGTRSSIEGNVRCPPASD
jgi:pilus assembly protein CpaB